MGRIDVRRVYDDGPVQGTAFLVDRMWPRGVRKDDLDAAWVRDVAPSKELRIWFGHDPDRWDEFQRRYAAELDAGRGTAAPLLDAARAGPVTLLYSAKDTEHNNALVLRDWLLRQPELRRH